MMDFISYSLIRIVMFPFSLFPYSWIHKIGNGLGLMTYYLIPKFRKRCLSNLALAKDLNLSESQIISIAKQAFQNLMITCLEYPKLARETDIHRIATCENPEEAEAILKQGKGLIFFCGHQANWEILFLEGTSRMPGVAIGRPIKNRLLYQWIISIRQKFGGKIFPPQNAAKEGLRAMKRGYFLGIVGDQGMPDSGYKSLFLGREAWTSPLPALLSYRTGCPISVAVTIRQNGHYLIRYSPAFYPNLDQSLEEQIPYLMGKTLKLFEQSIKEHPGQWLWQHNRWKQQPLTRIKRRFRQDAIGIFLPQDIIALQKLLPHLPTFREIYPSEFLAIYVPAGFASHINLPNIELISYTETSDLFAKDYRLKLIFNFTQEKKLKKHFLKLSAFDVLTLEDLQHLAHSKTNDLSSLLKQVIYAG